LDFPNIAPGNATFLTVTVSGASVGDVVSVGYPAETTDIAYFSWVSASDTVSVRAYNMSTTTSRDPASGTFKFKVLK